MSCKLLGWRRYFDCVWPENSAVSAGLAAAGGSFCHHSWPHDTFGSAGFHLVSLSFAFHRRSYTVLQSFPPLLDPISCVPPLLPLCCRRVCVLAVWAWVDLAASQSCIVTAQLERNLHFNSAVLFPFFIDLMFIHVFGIGLNEILKKTTKFCYFVVYHCKDLTLWSKKQSELVSAACLFWLLVSLFMSCDYLSMSFCLFVLYFFFFPCLFLFLPRRLKPLLPQRRYILVSS